MKPMSRRTIMRPARPFILGLVLAFPLTAGSFLAWTHTANAQTDPLQQAEDAYTQIDYEGVRTHVTAALNHGGYDRTKLVRIFMLLGMSNAVLGSPEDAKKFYQAMLAIDPEKRLDRSLSPQILGPYLEARGYWTSRTDHFGAQAEYSTTRGALVVRLTDPLSLATQVAVQFRTTTSGPFTTQTIPIAMGTAQFPIPDAAHVTGVQFALALQDAHENILFTLGTEDTPQTAGTLAMPLAPDTLPRQDAAAPSPLPVAGGVVLGLGGAFLVGGIAANIVRENLAATWNNDQLCLQPGLTRMQSCGSENSGIQTTQTLSAISYALAGVSVISGIVMMVVAPKEQARPRAVHVQCSPGIAGIVCAGVF